ncbi:MAG: hypothetical protein IJQ96_02110 [Bacteroidales bacterium]|nr:hypothetical protein [Bacteroidales bacterium]
MRNFPCIFVLLFLLLGSQCAFAYDGYGTADQPYLIKSASDWTQLYQDSRFNNKDYAGKYFRLVADISVIDDYYFDNVVGWDSDYPFRGVFDGDGHTLTFTSYVGEQGTGSKVLEYMAPFRYVGDGAVIKNLHVVGIAQTYKQYLAGLVARVSGKVVIRNCWVSTDVNTTGPRNYTTAYNGGIVAEAYGPNSDLTLENCRFDGKMSEKEWVDYSGGLVGKADGKVTLKNCLFKPSKVEVTADHCATLVRMGSPESLTLDKCYYFTPMGTLQGTNASSMSTSDLAASLGGQWEVINGDNGEAVPILYDITPFEGTGTSGSPYLIASIENWNYLMYRVSLGNTFAEKHFQLTNNVKIHKMIGEYSGDGAGQQKPFSGILDGNGNTLTLDLEGSGSHIAPFACIQNATIKNLILAGSVTTSGMRPAGITSFVMGDQNLIENCKTSTIGIKSTYNADVDAGAFVGRVNANAKLTIRGCSLEGPITIQYNSGYEGGGFVGFAQDGAHVTVQDCVFGMVVLLSTKGKPGSDVYSEQYYMFVGGSKEATVNITNCYYMPSFILNPLLKNGSVKAQGMRQYNIDGSDGVTVKLDGAETYYNVSKITAYSGNYGIKTGIYSWPWGAEGQNVKLLLSKGGQPVKSYTANHGTLTGTGYSGTDDPYTLNVSKATLDSDVTDVYISADGVLYLQDSDNSSDIIDKEDTKTHTVILGRTLQGGNWNSFSAPFAISAEMVASVFGDGVVIKKLKGSSFDNGALSLSFEDVTSIEAGKAYLIKPADNVAEPRFESVTINKNTYPIQTTVADFVPVINPTSFTARDKTILFFTSDGKLSFPSDEGPMKGFRGYLQLKGAAAGQ